MKFQKQAFHHKPEAGQYGDCHRTVIACLLNLDRDSVPNFGVHYGTPGAFQAAEKEFLKSQGLGSVSVAYTGTLEEILNAMEWMSPKAYYILGGTSKNGLGHSVIGLGNRIIWDPSLDDSGIVGPMEGNVYWITFLVPYTLVEAST